MANEILISEDESKEIITSTIFCVNTNFAYVYELLHGDIIRETKIAMKDFPN